MLGLLRLHQFLLALGTFLLALFLGWGLPMIFPSTPHNGIAITVIGAVLTAPLFIRAFILYRRQQGYKIEHAVKILDIGGRVVMSAG